MKSVNSKGHRFPLWPQYLATLELFVVATMIGLTAGWTSPSLAKLSKPDSPLPITKEQASWIASLPNIATTIGSVLGALSGYFIGSKPAVNLSGIPFVFSWMCFLIADSVYLIYLSRILGGIGIGMFYCTFPLYIGEISNSEIRGALVSFIMQGLIVGNLLGNIMGTYLDIWVFAAISLIPNSLAVGFFYMMPHTPYHLIRCNKVKEASISIQWYNRNADVESELKALKKFMQSSQTSTFRNALRELTTPINRKILLMINIIYGLAQLCGFYIITAYLDIMLTEAKVTILSSSTVVIGASILGMVSSLVATYTSDKYGRTKMLITSSAGAAAALFLWGLNYQLLDLGIDNPNLQWMSLIAVILFKISITAGLVPVPPILKSELFATNVKGFAACITTSMSNVFAFIVTKSYQPMVDVLTKKYVFWIYGLLMIILVFYTWIFVPETKGKSLAEIQEMLTSKKLNRSDDEHKMTNTVKETELMLL